MVADDHQESIFGRESHHFGPQLSIPCWRKLMGSSGKCCTMSSYIAGTHSPLRRNRSSNADYREASYYITKDRSRQPNETVDKTNR
mmetsp:Transcript_3065/g.6826  ORF Transcript_3065/g.6826 Transcript_3065/m.6826 type:complete len:86 (-) Transcript_3065:3954-4211(-)